MIYDHRNSSLGSLVIVTKHLYEELYFLCGNKISWDRFNYDVCLINTYQLKVWKSQ